MSEQTKQDKPAETKTEPKDTEAKDLSKKGDEIKEGLDALIDEIDEVLEENAAEFVKNYVQRGGQ
jgi:ubiquitin-like protein Pup